MERVWEQVEESLNIKFMSDVSQQYLQNRFSALKSNCAERTGQEECISGVLPETSNLVVFRGNSRKIQRKR